MKLSSLAAGLAEAAGAVARTLDDPKNDLTGRTP